MGHSKPRATKQITQIPQRPFVVDRFFQLSSNLSKIGRFDSHSMETDTETNEALNESTHIKKNQERMP